MYELRCMVQLTWSTQDCDLWIIGLFQEIPIPYISLNTWNSHIHTSHICTYISIYKNLNVWFPRKVMKIYTYTYMKSSYVYILYIYVYTYLYEPPNLTCKEWDAEAYISLDSCNPCISTSYISTYTSTNIYLNLIHLHRNVM